MKKKKERTLLAGGTIIIALVVTLLLVYSTGGTPAVGPSQNATTTPAATQTQATTQKPSGASAAPAPVDTTVRGVVSRLAGARVFAGLMESTGVGATLASGGPYTVFVPSDKAFSQMPAGFLSGLASAAKKRLVQYHVVAGKSLDLDAVSSGNHEALSKDMLNFNVNLDSMVAYVNSGVSISQHKASNGIVYVVSAVLVPPQIANPSTGSTGTPTPR